MFWKEELKTIFAVEQLDVVVIFSIIVTKEYCPKTNLNFTNYTKLKKDFRQYSSVNIENICNFI